MKKATQFFIILLVSLNFAITSCNNETDITNTPTFESKATNSSSDQLLTIEDSVSYAIGSDFGRQVVSEFKGFNEIIFENGFQCQLNNNHELIIDPNLSQQIIQSYFNKKQVVSENSKDSNPSQNISTEITTMEDTVSYLLGMNFGQNFTAQIPDFNSTLFLNAMKNSLSNSKPLIDSLAGQKIIKSYFSNKNQIEQENKKQIFLKKFKKVKTFWLITAKKRASLHYLVVYNIK